MKDEKPQNNARKRGANKRTSLAFTDSESALLLEIKIAL